MRLSLSPLRPRLDTAARQKAAPTTALCKRGWQIKQIPASFFPAHLLEKGEERDDDNDDDDDDDDQEQGGGRGQPMINVPHASPRCDAGAPADAGSLRTEARRASRSVVVVDDDASSLRTEAKCASRSTPRRAGEDGLQIPAPTRRCVDLLNYGGGGPLSVPQGGGSRSQRRREAQDEEGTSRKHGAALKTPSYG